MRDLGAFEGCSQPPFIVVDGERVPVFAEEEKIAQSEREETCTPLPKTGGYVQFCDETTMAPKAHGTTEKPVQEELRWKVDRRTANRICCFNRHAAEYPGYWKAETKFLKEVSRDEPTVYYDSVTGKPLFVAPIGRSMENFLGESETHGWPSFRDQEVVWENMRVLKATGEAVSADGTHLGHNIPDAKGNRYCINIVSVAGRPASDDATADVAEVPQEDADDGAGWLPFKLPGFFPWS
jgi:peptide methionine sulfoxide reductase MsrB